MTKIKLKRKKPSVAYAGSLVQQNHGEMLENHGYLLWDVPTRTFTEHHLHNDYGFLTVDVVDDFYTLPQPEKPILSAELKERLKMYNEWVKLFNTYCNNL